MKKINIFLVFIFILMLSTNVFAINKWTIMVHLCADNDLNYFSYLDVNEMEQIGSTTGDNALEIVLLWDRNINETTYGDPNWDGTRIYTVKKDTDVNTVTSPYIDTEEKNMGDPQTAIDFANYCKTNHPAENYMYVFWDHGDGWSRNRDMSKNFSRGVCTDSSSDNDHLGTGELVTALSEMNKIFGKKLDIVGFDACLMQMIEVEHALKDYASYMIGSEQTEPGYGWSYNTFLEAFTTSPDDKEKILKTMVDSYINFYENWYQNHGNVLNNVTMSAVNLSKINTVSQNIKDFADYATKIFDYEGDAFRRALAGVTIYDTNNHVDLYHFIGILATYTKDTTLKQKCESLLESIYNAVVYNKVTQNNQVYPNYGLLDVADSFGIAAYFPLKGDFYDQSNYTQLDFAKDTGWNKLIEKYYGTTGVADQKGSITIKATDCKILCATKQSEGNYSYSKVDKAHFDYGYYSIIGNYPYSKYENNYYQIYFKFDFSSLKEHSSTIVIEDVEIYTKTGMNRILDREIIATLKEKLSKDYLLNEDLELLKDVKFSKRIEGDYLNNKVLKWIKGEEDNNGMVIGYDLFDKNNSYAKGFDIDDIEIYIKYRY